MATRETPVTPVAQKCWSWSIQPLAIWIRILGVDIPDISMERSRRFRCFTIIYGALCFLLHVTGQGDVLYFLHRQRVQNSLELIGGVHLNSTTIGSWNMMIDFTNFSLFSIGGHLILLVIIRPRWIAMVEYFQQAHLAFSEEYYVRIRKLSLWSIIFIVILVFGLGLVMIGDHVAMGTRSIHRIAINIISVLAMIYPLTGLSLYFILSYASLASFQSIQMKIKAATKLMNCNTPPEVTTWLTIIRRQTIGCSETIDCVNHISGWTLLLSTPFTFLSAINNSFYLFGQDYYYILPTDVIFFLFSTVILISTCYTADHVTNEANRMVTELFRLNCGKLLIRLQLEQMKLLDVGMAQMVPQISANSYFAISKKLIPQLIGTSVSYFCILYQFKTSEIEPSVK